MSRPGPDVVRTARFDRTKRYRYALGRVWDEAGPRAVFVLLNPSAADATHDDPTLRRCMAFAKRWGYGALDVVNLFAWRTARPRELAQVPEPVGPSNDRVLRATVGGADLLLAGWGNGGTLRDRAAAVLPRLRAWGPRLHCLGLTARGQPRHPLYVRGDARPVPW